jgi:hypothetical protein
VAGARVGATHRLTPIVMRGGHQRPATTPAAVSLAGKKTAKNGNHDVATLPVN